jgi:hypothetical protein
MLSTLEAQDVRLTLVGGRVRCDGPAEVLDPATLQAIAAAKPEVVRILEARQSLADHVAMVAKAQAFFPASEVVSDTATEQTRAAELLRTLEGRGIGFRLRDGQPVMSGKGATAAEMEELRVLRGAVVAELEARAPKINPAPPTVPVKRLSDRTKAEIHAEIVSALAEVGELF